VHAADEPVTFVYVAYVSEKQGEEGPPMGPKKPARHKQSVELLQPMSTGVIVKGWDCWKMQLST
jgi:hypothetical protein